MLNWLGARFLWKNDYCIVSVRNVVFDGNGYVKDLRLLEEDMNGMVWHGSFVVVAGCGLMSGRERR